MSDNPRRHLRNISGIRTFLRTNETPVCLIGPTAFNLLGLDRWVRNFSYVASGAALSSTESGRNTSARPSVTTSIRRL